MALAVKRYSFPGEIFLQEEGTPLGHMILAGRGRAKPLIYDSRYLTFRRGRQPGVRLGCGLR